MKYNEFDFKSADYQQKERMKALARNTGAVVNDEGEIVSYFATNITSHRTVAQDKRDAKKARNRRRAK